MAKRTATGVLFRPTFTDRHGRKCETSKWYVRVTVPGGKTKKVPLDDDHATSLRMAMDAEKNAKQGVAPAGSGFRLRDLVQLVKDDYVATDKATTHQIKPRAKHLEDFFGNCRMDKITSDAVKKYAAFRKGEGAKNGTINLEIALLKRGRRLAFRLKAISVPFDFEKLPEKNARKGYFEPEELDQILTHAPEWMRWVKVCSLTGWRPKELLSLRREHVDFRRAEMYLPPNESKNEDGRTFPFRTYPELRRVLEEQRDFVTRLEKQLGKRIEYFFPNSVGNRIHRAGYFYAWKEARDKAGMPNKLVYDCRRTVVRNMEERSVPRTRAMALVGHRTEVMYKRYAIVAKPDLERAVGRLSDEAVDAVVERAIEKATEDTDVS